MGLYSKDTETKMDLLAVPSVNSCLKARTQYIKESSTSVWSIALQSRTFGLSFFKWSPLKNSTSLTEKQFCIEDVGRDCRVPIIEVQL